MMKDQDIVVDNSPSALSPLNSREQALLVTYDFLKHMSTLAIVAMGGMLGIAQGSGAQVTHKTLVSVGIVGLSGLLSLMFLAAATLTQVMQRVHKSSIVLAFIFVNAVLVTFSYGLFMFIDSFFKAMK